MVAGCAGGKSQVVLVIVYLGRKHMAICCLLGLPWPLLSVLCVDETHFLPASPEPLRAGAVDLLSQGKGLPVHKSHLRGVGYRH